MSGCTDNGGGAHKYSDFYRVPVGCGEPWLEQHMVSLGVENICPGWDASEINQALGPTCLMTPGSSTLDCLDKKDSTSSSFAPKGAGDSLNRMPLLSLTFSP